MGNKSSRIEEEEEDPHDESSSSTTSSSSSSEPQEEQTPVLRPRLSHLERRSTVPMELEDPEDFCVGESQAEYFPYNDDDSISTINNDDDHDKSNKHPLAAFRERLLTLPKEARNILAGGMAGIVAKSVVAPLDRIKILYQVSSAQYHILDVPKAVRNIVQTEGFTALWKGNLATMIRIFPYSGIQFMVFDRIKHYFLHEQEQHTADTIPQQQQQQQPPPPRNNTNTTKWGLSPLESLVSGMIAGTVSVICTYPLDLTRAQLAVLKKQKSHNQSFWSVLTDNYKSRGTVGLFRGITPTLLGILPYSGVAFALNEQGKREIQHLQGREVTVMERIQCGAFAGLVAQTLTYPIEVTRRRMQTIGIVGIHNDSALSALGCKNGGAVARALRPPSLMSTVKDLYAEQGTRGFMKGVSMNWMKGPVAFGISFTTFDHIQKWMESAKEREARLPPKARTTTTTKS